MDVQKHINDGILSKEDVMKTVASGNQRQQILTITAIKTAIDENKNISPAFEASAYASREIDDAYSNFIQKVTAIDNKKDTPAEEPVSHPADEDTPPFDIGDNSDAGLDPMDWMKNFK